MNADVGIADDGFLQNASDAQVAQAVLDWKAMGIDTVRVFAKWD